MSPFLPMSAENMQSSRWQDFLKVFEHDHLLLFQVAAHLLWAHPSPMFPLVAPLNSSLKAMAPGLSVHLVFSWFDFRCSWSYWWHFIDSEMVQHFLFLKYLLSSLIQEITLGLALLSSPGAAAWAGRQFWCQLGKRKNFFSPPFSFWASKY